jgi:hypothetical protein
MFQTKPTIIATITTKNPTLDNVLVNVIIVVTTHS